LSPLESIHSELHARAGVAATCCQFLKVVEVFDPKTSSWTNGTALPETLAYADATAAGGRLYVVGGDTGPKYEAAVLVY
jgi:N-acetylneuraminic acid mutarotase